MSSDSIQSNIPDKRMGDPLVRILWDTNVFVSALLFGSVPLLDYLENLIDQKRNGFIDFVVPKAVQAEFYAVLRAGSVQKNKQSIFLTHDEILYFIEPYLELFDTDYLFVLNSISWPVGKEYKEIYRQLVEDEYGWSDFGQAYIEKRLHNPVQVLGIKSDPYDYPIMATGLLFGVDLIVTSNLKDFIDPLGHIRVMNPNEARNFDHYSLHLPYDYFYEDDL